MDMMIPFFSSFSFTTTMGLVELAELMELEVKVDVLVVEAV
jgi:hypothetical protein